jgi:molybdopterin converting factor small subunit
MRVQVKCFATLCGHTPPGGCLELAQGATVADLLSRIDLTEQDLKLVFVNSRHADLGTVLVDGDQVGLFPAVGGG